MLYSSSQNSLRLAKTDGKFILLQENSLSLVRFLSSKSADLTEMEIPVKTGATAEVVPSTQCNPS